MAIVTNEFSESTMDAGSVDWLYNDQSTLLSDHPVTLKSDNTAKCLPHIIVTNIRSVKLIYEVDEIESKNKCKNNGVQVAYLTESWLNDNSPTDIIKISRSFFAETEMMADEVVVSSVM